jgi:hypothetical protein
MNVVSVIAIDAILDNVNITETMTVSISANMATADHAVLTAAS